jgi:hypothetical protein
MHEGNDTNEIDGGSDISEPESNFSMPDQHSVQSKHDIGECLKPNELITEQGYMDDIRDAETTGAISYFSHYEMPFGDSEYRKFGGEDMFGHLPFDNMGLSEPDATIDTPEVELLSPWQGYRPRHGDYLKMSKDVEGQGFINANSRHLSDVGKAAIDHYKDEEHLHFLELGAGAGVGAGEVSVKENATVDTAALCPTNPLHRLTKTNKEIYEGIERCFNDLEWDAVQERLVALSIEEQCIVGVKRLYFCIKENGAKSLLHPEYAVFTRVAFALHALFPELGIFDSKEEPYIRNQYIGDFPNAVEIPSNQYQVIHDDRGPMWHESRITDPFSDNPRPPATINDLMFNSYHLLADDGVLVCSQIEDNAVNMSDLEELNKNMKTMLDYKFYKELIIELGEHENKNIDVPTPADLILIGTEKNPPFVLAKSRSPIGIKMKKLLGLRSNQGGVFKVDNLLEKLEEQM